MKLIKYKDVWDEIIYGVIDRVEEDRVYAYWSGFKGGTPTWVFDSEIISEWDVINYEEETEMTNSKTIKGNDGLGTTTITKIEDTLSVAQEAMNNAYASVQGILQAHADKNGEDKPQELSKEFSFADFDKSVQRTWKKQDFKAAVSNAALGLTGEAGEVADLIKKAIYHGRNFKSFTDLEGVEHTPLCDSDRPISPEDVKDELSDTLFYVSAMAQEFGFTLEDVALHNKEKLEKRYKEGFTVEESAHKADKKVSHEHKETYTVGQTLKVVGDSSNSSANLRHGLPLGSLVNFYLYNEEGFPVCTTIDGFNLIFDHSDLEAL